MKASSEHRCRQLRERLSRYIDGEMTPPERRAIGAHLRRCPCCQTMADSLRHTIDLCHRAGSARLPADVKQRAQSRVSALLKDSRSGRPRA
jgi:anti-sigma factor RsiW